MKLQAIFLDRDGVINRERADYVKCWEEFLFLPGVLTALQQLATLPIPILVITNQSVIGREIVERKVIDGIHARAHAVITQSGGRIDDFFLCPHHPDAKCVCRKPQPGLLQQAAKRFGLDLSATVFVGDAITDYQAACAAGCQSILVQSGRQGAQLQKLLHANAHLLARRTAATVNAHSPVTPCATGATTIQASLSIEPPVVADLSAAVDLIMTTAR